MLCIYCLYILVYILLVYWPYMFSVYVSLYMSYFSGIWGDDPAMTNVYCLKLCLNDCWCLRSWRQCNNIVVITQKFRQDHLLPLSLSPSQSKNASIFFTQRRCIDAIVWSPSTLIIIKNTNPALPITLRIH